MLGVTGGPTGGGQLILADKGAVVCTDAGFGAGTAAGEGGVCIPFDELDGDSVLVVDDMVGTAVAFQVCVDMDGDSACTGGIANLAPPGCEDHIVFSHRSRGNMNINPLWIPPDFRSTYELCGSSGFPGYVVMICAGVDSTPSPHAHTATSGAVTGTITGGSPSGDFCGAPTATKAYVAP